MFADDVELNFQDRNEEHGPGIGRRCFPRTESRVAA